jgi:molybdopterin-binding protein
LQDVVARGSQTDTVITDVTKGIINSHVKIDTANNELSVVELKKSQ